MFVIYECKYSVVDYEMRGRENEFPELNQCPRCKARNQLKRHGFYDRNAIEGDALYRIPICRLRCPACGKTVTLLPDFLIPYYQHTVHTVMRKLKEKVVEGSSHGYRQLVRHYVKRFFSQLTSIQMFFREEGWLRKSPPDPIEKAIKCLEMILDFGESPFFTKVTGSISQILYGTLILP